ncbi:MAG: hypothetical protein WA902_05850, partial [Thermosynechococcaceae cyanobacterium]
MNRVLMWIDRSSPVILWAIASLTLCLLGGIDFYTGFELSFAVFYIIPVALAAWGISRNAGFVLSVASAGMWLTVNQLAGETFSHPAIGYW